MNSASYPLTGGCTCRNVRFEMLTVPRSFRTIATGNCTGLAGASYGAAITLHTVMRYPSRVGFVLLESPSLHIGNGRLLKDAAAAKQWPQRVYLGVGTAEGDTQQDRDRMVNDARELRATIGRVLPPRDVHFVEKEGAVHWFDAWKARLPNALTFLLSGESAARCAAPLRDRPGAATEGGPRHH